MSPSPAYLRQRLRYEPETGKLYWRQWVGHPDDWNTKYAGTEAFTALKDGYRVGHVDAQFLPAHHVVWAMHYGAWHDGMLDHRDKDRANNRITNLRPSSKQHNARNMHRARNNTSGVTGVYLHKASQLWHARIKVDGGHISLGYFSELEDAARARKAAEEKYGFDPAHGAPRVDRA